MRSAGLAYCLQSTLGMNLNGVVLVSPFMNAGSGIDGEEIDLPHVLYLPTVAATPWLATKNDLAHLHITPEARKRITMDAFDAGHMMYLHQPSMKKFHEDVEGFIRETDRL